MIDLVKNMAVDNFEKAMQKEIDQLNDSDS